MAAEIREVVEEGSYSRRIERAAGDRELEWMQKHFPSTIPEGFFFGYRWISLREVEFGVFKDTPENRRSTNLIESTGKKTDSSLEVKSFAELKEKAAELGIETKGKTPEQLYADVSAKKIAPVSKK